jgi:hypothetical protein
MPFLDSDTCAEGAGGYLFLPGFSLLYDAIHGWMDHVMKKASRDKRLQHPLLYVMHREANMANSKLIFLCLEILKHSALPKQKYRDVFPVAQL